MANEMIYIPGQFWATPVATSGDLPSGSIRTGETRVVLDTGEIYTYNGSSWALAPSSPIGATLTEGSVLVGDSADQAAAVDTVAQGDITASASGLVVNAGLDAAKIADGSVSDEEFQYLDGVTSAIQTQIDAKADELRTITEVTFTGGTTYSVTAVSGIYHFDTSGAGGAVTVTIPDSASGNNGAHLRIILADATYPLTVVTVSGQNIGAAASQRIAVAATGFEITSHFPETAWLITQDSRGQFPNDADEGTTVLTTNRWINFQGSSGIVDGGAITKDLANSEVDIAEGEVLLRASAASPTSSLTAYTLPATTIAIDDETLTYIIADYNGGTPRWDSTDDITTVDGITKVAKATVFRVGTTYMDVFDAGSQSLDFVSRWAIREAFTAGIKRVSGSQISLPGVFQLASTAGSFYSVLANALTPALSTSVAGSDKMTVMFRSGPTAWTRTVVGALTETTGTPGNAYSTYYNDLSTNTLTAVSPASKYTVGWVYWFFDTPSRMCFVMGQNQYSTVSEAEAASRATPTAVPPELQSPVGAFLVAGVYWQGSGSDFTAVFNRTTTNFTASTATVHNSLAGLQGGTTDQYSHLTDAEYTGTGTGTFVRAASPTVTGTLAGDNADFSGTIEGQNISLDATTGFFRLGPDTQNSWRLAVVANELVVQKKINATDWETQATIGV